MVNTGDGMDKKVRKVASVAEQDREAYRYWRSRSDAERMNATWELTLELYRPETLQMQREIVCIRKRY